MSDDEKVFVPSYPYEAGPARGVLSPFEPGTRTLPAGFQVAPGFLPLPVEIVLEKDVAVMLRDGVTIYTDVFRPAGSERVPVIVAWSPYGKSGGTAPTTTSLFDMIGVNNSALSGLGKFEGPDPAFWCANGYAICNPDPRGVANSVGDSYLWDRQEGRDCHDLIEWLADQEWCNGKVGMSGTSYLAVSQWFTAAERPPHLAAINPWEGISDVYRDLVLRGGMPDLGFTKQLQRNFAGAGHREDVAAEAEQRPLFSALWEEKIPRFEKITVPAYIVASYSNTLHTQGTFRAWRRIASQEKWLRIHSTQEWPDYYDEANREDLCRFFDHYLKGEDNGWEQTPRVRYATLDLHGTDRVEQPADTFPPAGVENTKFYLDASSRTLRREAPGSAGSVRYPAQALPGCVSFLAGFDEETELVGYPKAHLWVEAEGTDDMDLFVLVQKLDTNGTALQQFTVPHRSAFLQDVTDQSASVLRYKGSNGRLRVSTRHLDGDLSTDEIPAHTFDRAEKLAAGDVAEIQIDLSPVGLVLHPGEQLRLVISAHNLLGAIMPGVPFHEPQNTGIHLVHTGGARASYLQLPLKTA
ncbi:CocE/NonD family hydrolase [Streptomyces sp. RKAG290]|uniref:CocE/NonD family hydrolase n=1 Tax=Streptomyces sp. RKAG290 TaxID=2888348 RepID=UPI002033ECA4|nr:CocE/NonD family hydrolase [Streptomyces sp. RKAG290]MCM2410771.1 CocE/NonD family hydrolase [Streptomyces sp. RKAG290]